MAAAGTAASTAASGALLYATGATSGEDTPGAEGPAEAEAVAWCRFERIAGRASLSLCRPHSVELWDVERPSELRRTALIQQQGVSLGLCCVVVLNHRASTLHQTQ